VINYMGMSKKEYVETLISNVSLHNDNESILEYMKNYLLLNIPNGKLYKYREVSDYSLDNLRNNTLFCAKPSQFNDPFDCRLGIELGPCYDVLFGQMIQNAERFIAGFVNENSSLVPENLSLKERELFCRWKNNSDIYDFVNMCNREEISFEEYKKALRICLEMVLEYILFDRNLFGFDLKSSHFNKVLSQVIKSIESITYTDTSFGDSIESILKCSETNVQGDQISRLIGFIESKMPDFHLEAKQLDMDMSLIENELMTSIDDKWKIGCLCDNHKNNLMWSHYANGHKGFCIEYDFSKWDNINSDYLILPVCYGEERVQFPWDVALPKNKGYLTEKAGKTFLLSLVSKDKSWEYEGEWRIISMNSEGINVLMPSISCIYLGACCGESDKSKLIEIAKERKIPVKQMVLDRGKFILHEVNV